MIVVLVLHFCIAKQKYVSRHTKLFIFQLHEFRVQLKFICTPPLYPLSRLLTAWNFRKQSYRKLMVVLWGGLVNQERTKRY